MITSRNLPVDLIKSPATATRVLTLINTINAVAYRLCKISPFDLLSSLWRCVKMVERLVARAFELASDQQHGMIEHNNSECLLFGLVINRDTRSLSVVC